MNIYTQLLFSALCSLLCFSIMNSFLETAQYYDMLIIAVILFSIISLVMHLLANSKKSKGNRLLVLLIGNMLVKIVVSFIVIYLYLDYRNPESKLVIFPFLTTYLVFTGFEAYSLSKLAESG